MRLLKTESYKKSQNSTYLAVRYGTNKRIQAIARKNGLNTVRKYEEAASDSQNTLRACKTFDDLRSISSLGHKDAGIEERTFMDANGFVHVFYLRAQQIAGEDVADLWHFFLQDVSGITHPSSADFEKIIEDALAASSGTGLGQE